MSNINIFCKNNVVKLACQRNSAHRDKTLWLAEPEVRIEASTSHSKQSSQPYGLASILPDTGRRRLLFHLQIQPPEPKLLSVFDVVAEIIPKVMPVLRLQNQQARQAIYINNYRGMEKLKPAFEKARLCLASFWQRLL